MTEYGSAVIGWGTALPPTVVDNADLVSLFETSDEWIVERSGIRSRRVATGPFVGGQVRTHSVDGVGTTARLAVEAAAQALTRAGISASEIEMLILCTTTPDQAMPATAAAVAGALGVTAGALDLNAACAGFSYGLVMANALISAGAGKVMLIGAETMTRIINWEDRMSAFLFGDGAGALVLERAPGPRSLLGWDAGVDGALGELLYADHGGGISMRGPEVFRRAVLTTSASASAALRRAKVEAADIALFVPHQANSRLMASIAGRLGIPAEKVASVIEQTANTSSASIPLALADAIDHGRVKQDDILLFAGFGAGMSWASVVWRWQLATDRRPELG
jgi:3-oxoacyl-[acyl-carrier-protein] synthase-3